MDNKQESITTSLEWDNPPDGYDGFESDDDIPRSSQATLRSSQDTQESEYYRQEHEYLTQESEYDSGTQDTQYNTQESEYYRQEHDYLTQESEYDSDTEYSLSEDGYYTQESGYDSDTEYSWSEDEYYTQESGYDSYSPPILRSHDTLPTLKSQTQEPLRSNVSDSSSEDEYCYTPGQPPLRNIGSDYEGFESGE